MICRSRRLNWSSFFLLRIGVPSMTDRVDAKILASIDGHVKRVTPNFWHPEAEGLPVDCRRLTVRTLGKRESPSYVVQWLAGSADAAPRYSRFTFGPAVARCVR